MKLQKEFSKPPAQYRGKPFWAWNGKIEEDEARWQVNVFKEMGLGGGFMHSRVGLDTPYLSKEWFELVNACADEAAKNKMEMWLYDEDRWPSGAAGGLVTKDPQYRMRFVEVSVLPPSEFKPKGDELAVFVGLVDDANLRNLRQVKAGEAVKKALGGEKVISCRMEIQGTSSWYNNYTYLDTISDEAVRKFIEVTHDAYAKHCSKHFGKTIPGIFTDEPNYGNISFDQASGKGAFPWTGKLPEVFKKRYGYDLIPHLAEILFKVDGKEFSKVRRDYFDCICHLFTDSFARQIFEWCEKHKIAFTGHVLAEETLRYQTGVIGTAMRFYEYMQAPGIDILRASGLKRQGGCEHETLTVKQCASACHQFDRKWFLCEIYGCTGWHFDFAEHKAVGDWQAALGVNLRCQHLSWYTMKGEAKRDYPASIFYQSPWWRDYGVVEDYFSRVGLMLTQGEVLRDVAVLHPIESAWGVLIRDDAKKQVDLLDKQLKDLQDALLAEHFDFDYVDEDILARHGAAEGSALRVAKASYKTIIVPPLLTVRESTVKILKDFASNGGTVLMTESLPGLCVPNDDAALAELRSFSKSIASDAKALNKALSKIPGIQRASITKPGGKEYHESIYMLRHDKKKGQAIVFVSHSLQDKDSGALEIALPFKGQVQEWDATSGEVFLADSKNTKVGVVIKTSLPPCGSRLFVVSSEPDKNLAQRPKGKSASSMKLSQRDWDFELNEPNAFPLDMAEFAIDGGPWQGPLEILRLDSAARDACGLAHRGAAMVQPWARTKAPEEKMREVSLRYRFSVEKMPETPCRLVVETPSVFKFTLNGKPLSFKDEGWWIDKSFRMTSLPSGALRLGENILEMSTTYTAAHGFEAIYICGDFGFKWAGREPVITELPQKLQLGDWRTQGLACYTGAVIYKSEFENTLKKSQRLVLSLPEWKGVVVKVRVNGKLAGKIAWAPHELDITDLLKNGLNKLSLELVSSRRNLLGPLHYSEVYPTWTGNYQYVSKGQLWTDDYVSLPYGLMASPVLSARN